VVPKKDTEQSAPVETSAVDTQKTIDTLTDQVAALAIQITEMHEKEGGVAAALGRVQLQHDPFDAANPMKIIEHPKGFRLGWKNVDLREDRLGWKGWDPVLWDSALGKDIHRYINNPPKCLKASEHDNNYIMRGADTALAVIPEELYNARMHNLGVRNEARVAGAGTLNLPGRTGVQETGKVTIERGTS